MCAFDGCLDFNDVIFNPKLMDMSLKMAIKLSVLKMKCAQCEQFPASLLLDCDKKYYLDLCGILFKVCLVWSLMCLTTGLTNTHTDTA